MIGFLINGIKGIQANLQLKKRLEETEKQLNDIQSIENLFEQLDNPYDIVIAKNQFLLAKFFQLQRKNTSTNQLKNAWERVKEEMFSNIQQTEQQLMELTANKLDIARIVASLSQLSNELDIELKQNNQLVESMMSRIDTKQECMESELTKLSDSLATIQSTFDFKTDELEVEINTIKETVMSLEKSIDKQIQGLQEQLQTQKTEWTKQADLLDQAILSHAKEQKKTLLIWTIPLYVVVVGMIVGLVILW